MKSNIWVKTIDQNAMKKTLNYNFVMIRLNFLKIFYLIMSKLFPKYKYILPENNEIKELEIIKKHPERLFFTNKQINQLNNKFGYSKKFNKYEKKH